MKVLSNQTLIVQLSIYGGILIFFWLLELLIFPQKLKNKIAHTTINAKFLFFVLPVQVLLSLVVFYVSRSTETAKWGILHFLPDTINPFLFFILAFLILDLFDYMYHFMMHKTPLFWKFHQVHHSDMQVDISTTVREHPGETFIRVSYLIVVICIVGAAPWVLILKQFIQSFSNLASHTRIILPKKVNDIVSKFFVTPNTHHIHHHYQLPYTDSNFGDVLTIWDRLFSTFSKMEPSQVVFGVDTNMNSEENMDFKNLIYRPFEEKIKG
ncbi:sterol desaturase family protein [Flavobacterium sp.]|uniref:sterol desaturase family protein n=1 Tax=Flavobacterium sp. TaxID=239 RepID=UPI003796EF88